MAKKKSKGRRGSRLIGNMGFKGLILSSGLLAVLKYLTRRYLPQAGAYTTGLSAVGAGAAGRALGTGKSLLQFGAVDLGSELIYDLVSPNGLVNLPGMGGNNNSSGGYDY